jgi:hypothetical protein
MQPTTASKATTPPVTCITSWSYSWHQLSLPPRQQEAAPVPVVGVILPAMPVPLLSAS